MWAVSASWERKEMIAGATYRYPATLPPTRATKSVPPQTSRTFRFPPVNPRSWMAGQAQ